MHTYNYYKLEIGKNVKMKEIPREKDRILNRRTTKYEKTFNIGEIIKKRWNEKNNAGKWENKRSIILKIRWDEQQMQKNEDNYK